MRATLLGSLLFLDRSDLLAEWSTAAAAVGGGSGSSNSQTNSINPAAAAGPGMAARGVAIDSSRCPEPHPALQLLLSAGVAPTVTVLEEATRGWDAVETDLRAAAGKPAQELASVLVATQVQHTLETASVLHL